MQMIRSFNSVGQGGFYTEHFANGFKVVYDCGTSSEQIHLIREIDSVFKKNDTINAVFISHFHEDHISGLEYLLDNFHVENIFIPLLTEENKVLTLLKYVSTGAPNEFSFEFILRPERAISSKDRILDRHTNIIYVNEYEEGDDEQEDTYFSLENNADDTIKSGTRIVAIKKEWIYVPFNFRQEGRVSKLKKALKDNSIAIPSNGKEVRDLLEDKGKRKILVEIFKNKVTGDLNTNSMTLYSGLEAKHRGRAFQFNIFRRYCRYRGCCCNDLEPGCLYTGDYELNGPMKWKNFITNYDKYLEKVGTIQIPHHGSHNNYNKELNTLGCWDYIISAGLTNKHHHPHKSVLKDILFSGKNLSVVTENVGSGVTYLIEF